MLLKLLNIEGERRARYANAEKTYRRIAGLGENDPITEISEDMLNRLAQRNGILHTEDLREYLLRKPGQE